MIPSPKLDDRTYKDIVDEAMRQGIVLCSPVTLLAFLGLIRQAFDSFMIEQTSDQILGLLGKFGEQWGKYTDSLETVKRRFDSVQKEFDNLLGTRKRALERPLRELEGIRREKNLPVDGQLLHDHGAGHRRRPRHAGEAVHEGLAAGAADHEAADRRILRIVAQQADEGVPHVERDGVELGRIVEHEVAHGAVAPAVDLLFLHRVVFLPMTADYTSQRRCHSG